MPDPLDSASPTPTVDDLAATIIVQAVYAAAGAPPTAEALAEALGRECKARGLEQRGWRTPTIENAIELASVCRSITAAGQAVSNPAVRRAMQEAGRSPGTSGTVAAVVRAAQIYNREILKKPVAGEPLEPERLTPEVPRADGRGAPEPDEASPPPAGLISLEVHKALINHTVHETKALVERIEATGQQRLDDTRAAARKITILAALVALCLGAGGGVIVLSLRHGAEIAQVQATAQDRVQQTAAENAARIKDLESRHAAEIERMLRLTTAALAASATTAAATTTTDTRGENPR